MTAVLALVLALVAVGLAVMASRGSARSWSRGGVSRGGEWPSGPAWTRPCWRQTDIFSRICGQVDGRVVWRQLHDSDGDGDRHLLVVEGFSAHLVKLRAGSPIPVPGIGAGVRFTGRVMRGASGRDELVAAAAG